MAMRPFLEFFPAVATAECRSITLMDEESGLPADAFGLLESYCDEHDCDCRRVVLTVISSIRNRIEATISFAFDPDDPMPGPFLDPLNEQGPHAEEVLDLVQEMVLSDASYVSRLERHYQMVKKQLREEKQGSGAPQRKQRPASVAEPDQKNSTQAQAATPARFDIHRPIRDKSGGLSERALEKYINGLMDAFAASPEGRAIADSGAYLGMAGTTMNMAGQYLGVSVAQMSPRDFDEILFQIIPRKVSIDADEADAIVTELRAFWQFLDRQYALPAAAEIAKSLDERAIKRLRRELADPRNFGIAKSIVMQGMQAGFDMSTQEGISQFMLAYNAGILAKQSKRGLLSRLFGPAPSPQAELARNLAAILGPDVDDEHLNFIVDNSIAGNSIDPASFSQPLASGRDRSDLRKQRKRERQARKRNRR